MAVILYNIFLFLFSAAVRIGALFSPKAASWVNGRKNIFPQLEAAIPADAKVIWMHCASLGEFEQGRPLLEAIRSRYPAYRLLLTFFSPSGYEVRKNYEGVDWVFYLPADGPRNARKFLEIAHPELVIFVKYEFWYYYLKKIRYRGIPLLLVSANFWKGMSFFSWYGGLYRKMLSRFEHVFVQNENSLHLLNEIGLGANSSIAGDTRFDRVSEIAGRFTPLPLVEAFCGTSPVLVCGSTWPDDEQVIAAATQQQPDLQELKIIIAPHETGETHIQDILRLFPGALRYSGADPEKASGAQVLVIDNIGMLSRIYRYGWVTYVGGGLKKSGIHNVLEAAVYGKIVLFGPNYRQYAEAVGLIKCGGAISFTDEKKDGKMLRLLLNTLLEDENEYRLRSAAAAHFVESHKGATGRIMRYIQEKRLLTS